MEWLGRNGENAAFLVYWLCIAVFAVIEWGRPAFSAEARRHNRWPTNFGLGIATIGLSMLVPVTAVVAAQRAQTDGIGILNVLQAPFWAAAVVTIVLRSLASYSLHFANHKLRFLWRFHRVHHCDTHLDVSTSLRHHPLEVVLQFSVTIPLAVAVGFDPWALAAFELTESGINALSHANVRLPEEIDRPLRWIFVTPNMHCLHHSAWQPETDSNYGQVFSFWDRLFGTYSAAPHAGFDAMRIGLNDIASEQAEDIVWQMKLPALPADLRARAASPAEKSAQP